jgi:hypothetical protein
MNLINRNSSLWSYCTNDIKELIEDGERLLNYVEREKKKSEISDFSFTVFPFAKAYEGFLKKFFFDLGFISYEEYYGDEIRIGRILNPRYVKEHTSVFARMCDHSEDRKLLSQELWETWKKGRNRIFHYFPHNFRKISYEEALEIINTIVSSMNSAVVHCNLSIAEAKN